MNTKTAETETVARPAGRPNVPGGRTVLASDIRLTGNLSSSGTVEILGEVNGDVSAQTLVVGAEGLLKGSISAEAVEVRGHLEGKVSCLAFTLRSSAIVTAEVNYETLVIESGAQIDGKFKHTTR
ncbi:MAG: polymer-forming cytoskeletal protein [Cereibacter sphaeroides]|uniref:Polymer-forming cytoskeletal protein n=1 Tax=Cereibacter sphaeroides TaxID=1063 RepID=A0A2W5TXT9_CERSP|nr:MAG: polymer-forming cytoskeletal protein [Cereibacter sphaeroides]